MEKESLVKEICPTTTQAWIKNGAVLVDVREKDEVEALAFNVPHLINVPLTTFEEDYNRIPIDKDLVLVCNNGSKSLRAAGFLVNHGYTRVVNMQYGLQRWVAKGFPTKGDTSTVLHNTQSASCCGIETGSKSCS